MGEDNPYFNERPTGRPIRFMLRPSRVASACVLALTMACTAGTSRPTARPPTPAPASRTATWDPAALHHVLDRFAFGPRPGDVARLESEGVERWFARQLAPSTVPDPNLDGALAAYRSALAPPHEILASFARGDVTDDTLDVEDGARPMPLQKRIDAQRLVQTLMLAELTRHVVSERQIQEVMVDFWTNHFNVFARKGPVIVVAGDYIERAIRPHALGRFEDLLLASARHPAMLFYLDNAQSVAPRTGNGQKRRRGLNENYARELLELHTLGVNGGYTQQDVIEVARILTGWGVRRPQAGDLGFVFRSRRHDSGDKLVLGKRFSADGEQEGRRLLAMLARHPATARHLATKLCARFVSDSPSPGCVERVTRAYRESDGRISALLRAVVDGPEFWRSRGTKVKSALEFVASALRTLDGRPNGELGLAGTLRELGQPLLMEPVPVGYPEAAEDWASSGPLLGRMNFALALASERAKGVDLELDRVLPVAEQREEMLRRVAALVLPSQGSPQTLTAIRTHLADVEDAHQARKLALALALASPDFQRQ